MTVIHIDQSQTTAYVISQSDKTYILDPGIHVFWLSDAAMHVTAAAGGNELRILGMLGSGSNKPGLLVEGEGTVIGIGRSGNINSPIGILVDGVSTDIVNHGHVTGDDFGIAGQDSSGRLINYGQISADTAGAAVQQMATSGSFRMENYGVLSGENGLTLVVPDVTVRLGKTSEIYAETGIFIVQQAGESSDVINQGLISSASGYGFRGGGGGDVFINRGTVHGLVYFDSGNDKYVDKGKQIGEVGGGPGDDLFILRRPADIIELAGEGTDTVRIGKSYTLSEHVETLIALGREDLRLGGGDTANTIRGNSGNNRISGAEGADTLTGGGGKDLFLYAKFDGIDTISDFRHGQDRIRIEGFTQYTNYADLDILTQGDDVRISFADENGADFITVKNQKVGDFDKGDFLFG